MSFYKFPTEIYVLKTIKIKKIKPDITIKYFHQLFFNFVNDKFLIDKLWNEIEEFYSQDWRFYHNLEHLSHMLTLFEEFSYLVKDKNAVLFSIFYHDFYYFPKRNDNEKRSAEKLSEVLLEINIPKKFVEKCKNFILYTQNHSEIYNFGDTDLLLFLDLDLAILGSEPNKYQIYVQNIRKEYSHVNEIDFRSARHNFAEKMLANQPIFKTNEIAEIFENQAIKNLSSEINKI